MIGQQRQDNLVSRGSKKTCRDRYYQRASDLPVCIYLSATGILARAD